ncbi:MAG: GGDEF domain-containing protein [Gammaproteobacteria bacterium]|nr:GGDEF domain-containing protein [Gammaproteobacteria bacterium]
MNGHYINPENKLADLLSRFYFLAPLVVLSSLPLVELIVSGSVVLSLANILIALASFMCLVTWTMSLHSRLLSLMPLVISSIAATSLALLMISNAPDLDMHATAAVMIITIWLTSAPGINILLQSIVTFLMLSSLVISLIKAQLSDQNLITICILLVSAVMMGVFSGVHRRIHAVDNLPGDMLTGDLSNIVYDEEAERLFEDTHEIDLDHDWPQVLEKLSKSLNSIHDVDIVFSKMLQVMQDAIPYTAAAIGLLHGRELKLKQSLGDEDVLKPETLNWTNELIRSLAERKQPIISTFVCEQSDDKKNYYHRLVLPVLSNDKFIGVVTLIRDTLEFDTYSSKLSSSILFHSMVSLRNARLYEEFKKLKSQGKQSALITRERFMQASAKNIGKLNQPRNASLMIVEIDNFEKLEERYNKEVSLSVYQAIAELLLNSTRDNDVLGQYENNSYIILLNDTDLLDAKKQAERIRELISKTPCKSAVGKITTTASIGLASASDGGESIASLTQRSEMALYVAKQSGKNSVKVKL